LISVDELLAKAGGAIIYAAGKDVAVTSWNRIQASKREANPQGGLDSDVKALRGELEKGFSRFDWEGWRRFQESLGSYSLSEKDLFAFLRSWRLARTRNRSRHYWGLGIRTLRDRIRKVDRLTVEEAFARPGSEFLSPIETAVNEVVWRVDRKWLCPNPPPELSINVVTGDLRITGYAILRSVRRFYRLPKDQVIELGYVEVEPKGSGRYKIRLLAHGITTVVEEETGLRIR